jgi:hypothetical protein
MIEITPQLTEVATRLHVIEQRLTTLEAAQDAALKQYAVSDAAYREELSEYRAERGQFSRARSLAMVLRVVGVMLLVYIAYRVSA